MTIKKVFALLLAAVLFWAAHRSYGWMGVVLVASGLVMWLLLHVTRTLQVMRRAADRPVGYVASAVMLNAKLKPGQALLHVIALTRALGERLSAEGAEPEIYRWTDGGESQVRCEFVGGKLLRWTLERPTQVTSEPPAA